MENSAKLASLGMPTQLALEVSRQIGSGIDVPAIEAAVADAEAAATSAEAARDASIVNAQTYTTEALGRAAVADGATFDVQGAGDVASYRYRRTNSTTSVLIASFPSAAAVSPVITRVNGTMTMDKFVEGSGSVSPIFYKSIVFVAGDTFVVKAVTKGGERKKLNFYCNSPNSLFNVDFDLEFGTYAVQQGTPTASIVPVGDGAYECTVTVIPIAGAGSANVQFRMYSSTGAHPYTGDGTSGLFMESASITQNGGANLFTQPTDFANAYWTKAGGTITSNAGRYLGLTPAKPERDATSRMIGKKWTALGTSITSQGWYTRYLAPQTGMILTNAGVSGGSIGQGGSAGSLAIYNAIATIPTDSQLVTLEGPINDFSSNLTPLGTLGDTTTATFYGAVYAAIAAIITRAPSAKVVLLVTYGGDSRSATNTMFATNANGNKLSQFRNAMIEVAEALGIPAIDVGANAGIGYLTGSTLLSDGLHINSLGGTLYANYVGEELRRLALSGLLPA